MNPEPVGDAHFGTFAAQVGNNLVFGAERFNPQLPGRAYIMDGFTGDLIKTLASPSPTRFDQFGWSGAGVGDSFVVSSRLDDTLGNNVGAAYQFDATNGDLIRTIPNPFSH